MNLTDKLKKGSSNLSTFENSKEIERKKAMTINVDIVVV